MEIMVPNPSPAPTPSTYESVMAEKYKQYLAAAGISPYTVTPGMTQGIQGPSVGQQGLQTALNVAAKRQLAKALIGNSAATAGTVGDLGISTGGAASSTLGYAPSAGIGFGTDVGSVGAGISTPTLEGASSLSSTVPAGVGFMPYAGAAGAGLGAYGLYKGIEANDPKSSALSGAGMGLGLGMAAPLVGFGPLGWGALGLMALAGGAGGFGLQQLLGHESTRDIANKHTKSLSGQFKDDSAYQNYVNGIRAQYSQGAPDPSHPFHGGQYSTWDEYKKAGLDAADLTGVYGNIKTFGQDWTKINEDQRKAITKDLIAADLYKSKKGEVEITNQDKAREIYKSSLNKFLKEAKK